MKETAGATFNIFITMSFMTQKSRPERCSAWVDKVHQLPTTYKSERLRVVVVVVVSELLTESSGSQ